MNWIKLKEKFPNSYQEIRGFYLESESKDARCVLNNFLKTKGQIKKRRKYEYNKINIMNLKKKYKEHTRLSIGTYVIDGVKYYEESYINYLENKIKNKLVKGSNPN